MANSIFSGASKPMKAREFKTKEYIHYYDKEVVKDYDEKNPDNFLIEKVPTEYERIPIKEYINSFASKVGLKNELKGVVSKQQMDDFIATHKALPGYTDLTQLPDTQLEMERFINNIDNIWSSIPEELKGGLSKEDFLKTLTSDKIRQYVLSQLPKNVDGKDGD